jgi:glucose/arabinose dehydrogenase
VQRRTRVVDGHTAVQAGTVVQGNSSQAVLIDVLMNFEQVRLAVESGAQRLSEWRQLPAAYDHHRTVDLGNGPDGLLIILFNGD